MIGISKQLKEWAIQQRRYLHENPELSGQEVETCQYIRTCLKNMDIELLDYTTPNTVGFLKGSEGTKTIALRADIDALPIVEEGEKSYISKRDGVAHVCGHDGHTAILLAVAQWMAENRKEVKPNILFIFQSSEEMSPSGAEYLVNQGVLNEVDAVFGIHLWHPLSKGKISVCTGPMMASADEFQIRIKGKGGHGAMPHETVDPIYISSQIIGGLQSIISRRIDPLQSAVISVGRIEAGNSYNIIPNEATLNGTIRTFSEDVRQFIPTEMKRIVEGICTGFGAEGHTEIFWGVPPVINYKEMSKYVEKVVVSTFGSEALAQIVPVMASEDFSFYLQRTPGAFIFVGMGGEKSVYPHHHPKFDIDEEAIPTSIKLFIELVLRF